MVGGYGLVLAMDTHITESLKIEGDARDLIRAIQDMRKEADYRVTDRIQISVSGASISEILTLHQDQIERETLSRITSSSLEAPDVTRTELIGDHDVMISLKK